VALVIDFVERTFDDRRVVGSAQERILDVVSTSEMQPAIDGRAHRRSQSATGATGARGSTAAALEIGRTKRSRAQRNRAAVVEELRAELAARPATATGSGRAVPTLPALPAFGDLLPERGLRRGASYSVQRSAMLTMALLAGASRAGSWCGMVGMPGFGAEAAAGLGIDLTRVILVPAPGRQWLNVVATLVDVLDLVVVHPPARPYDAETQRLAARLRERGAVLLVQHPEWPGCELRMAITSSTWHGLGAGHGHLTSREVTVEATGRGTGGRRRTTRLWLPDSAGDVRVAAPAEDSDLAPLTELAELPGLDRPNSADLPGRRWERAG
jgi:hypothetical protein